MKLIGRNNFVRLHSRETELSLSSSSIALSTPYTTPIPNCPYFVTLVWKDSITCGNGGKIWWWPLHPLHNTGEPRYNDSNCYMYQRFCCKIEFAAIKKLDRTHLALVTDTLEHFFKIIHFVYFLESPRGDSNKYTKRMFSGRIKWEYQ